MPFSPEQIEDLFSYHKPRADQVPHYEAVREAAKTFAGVLVAHTPASADQTVAVRKLRECVHIANAAIALDGR
jgi:hypothetical protein